MASEPKYVRDYATEMLRLGRQRFVETFRGHVLLGVGLVAKVSERPPGWNRRTLNTIDQGDVQEAGVIANRVWRVERTRTVRGDARITVGQTADNDIALVEYTVSTHHCAFIFDIIGAYVIDLGSLNGTYVGAQLIPANRPTRVNDGVEITVGRIRFKYLQNRSFIALIDEEVRRMGRSAPR